MINYVSLYGVLQQISEYVNTDLTSLWGVTGMRLMAWLLKCNGNHIYGDNSHWVVYQNIGMGELCGAHINLGKKNGNASPPFILIHFSFHLFQLRLQWSKRVINAVNLHINCILFLCIHVCITVITLKSSEELLRLGCCPPLPPSLRKYLFVIKV